MTNEAIITYRKLAQDGKDIVIGGDLNPWDAIIEVPGITKPASTSITLDETALRPVYDYVGWLEHAVADTSPDSTNVTLDAVMGTGAAIIQTDTSGWGANLSSYRAAANFALGSYFQPATGSTWADYPLFGYRLTTANASNIASVRVTLHSPDDDAIRSFTSRFEGNGSSIIDECHAVIFNSSTVVGRVELVIAVRNASLLAEDPVMVELDGIYFEHENRQTSLRINHTSGGTDMTMSFALPITPFGGLSWASANLTRGAIAGTMTGITITTGTGFNANRTLDIMHLALQQRNLTTNVVNQTY
jgi:hypothetical protein